MLRTALPFASAANRSTRVLLPAASLLVWGVVTFSAVSWGLRWSAIGQSPSGVNAAAQSLPEFDASAAARSLGAAPLKAAAAPALASRFQLLGVMAGDATQAAALISVDGKTAKPYRVGSMVTDGLVLQSAQGRRISLGATREGPETLALELPAKK